MENITQKPASIFPDEYWLGKTEPKQALRLTRNALHKLLWNFFYYYYFLLTE